MARPVGTPSTHRNRLALWVGEDVCRDSEIVSLQEVLPLSLGDLDVDTESVLLRDTVRLWETVSDTV